MPVVEPDIRTVRVVLTSILGGGGGGGAAFTLNASTGSVSLVAGAGISLSSNASTITISNSAPLFSLDGYTGSASISAGSYISVIDNASTVKIQATGLFSGISLSGNSAGQTLLNPLYGVVISGGQNISLSGTTNVNNIDVITISGPNATNFSLNGSSSSVSLVAGAGIGFASNLSTITISDTNPVFSTVSMSASGLTTSSSTGTFNNALVFSGAGIASVGVGAGSVTISVPAAAAGSVSLTALGNTTSSSTGTFQNLLNVSGAGIVSVGVGGGGSITISATTPSVTNFSTISLTASGANTLNAASTSGTFNNVLVVSGQGAISAEISTSGNTIVLSSPIATNFSANGTSSSVSISAGANIGIGQANSTITISASVQTSSISLTALGNTTSSSSGTFSNLLNISGAGIVSVGVGAGSITVSATTPSVTNYSTVSMSASGNTTSSSTGTYNNALVFSGAGGVSVGVGAGSVTISGPSGGAAFTLNASTGSVSLVAGTGIAFASNASTITISNSITSVTLLPSRVSYTQNFAINEAGPVFIGSITTTGTTAATGAAMPWGSQLSMQRIYLPAPMNLSEVDLAFGISFPATNQGQGSLSQSVILYTFGNSTSLATVLSASRAVSWSTGTTTSGTASTIQQGWASNNVQPFTFASTSLSAGEYVAAHLLSWAAQSTSWTISVFGQSAITATSASTAFNAAPTPVADLSSGGIVGRTVFTASPTNAVVIQNGSTGSFFPIGSFGTWGTFTLSASSSLGSSFNSAVSVSVTGTATSQKWSLSGATTLSSTAFTATPLAGNVISNAGTGVVSGFTGTTVMSVLSNAGTAGFTAMSNGINAFGYNGTFGMTTNTTQASYLSGPFEQGIMATGGSAASIDLKSTAVTVTGSTALIQPWFALAGA